MSTLNIQVTYDDNVHQFNLVRENLNWSQLVTVLQSTIPQAVNTNPFVLYYGLDGESHQVRDQDTFAQLLSFPDILGLHFYGNANQDNMKSVYILPPVNDAFKKLSDFVNVHYSELENNPLLSRAVALLASSMTLSPGNYDDEMKQLENCTKSKGPDCFDAMWKMRNKLMKKQGQKFFKKFGSRHGSHKFSPYFMDRHHHRGFPSAPHQDFDAFPGSRHPFGGRGSHMRGFWGRRGPHSRFDYPSTFFDMTSDDEQDGENIPTETHEKTPTVHKDAAAADESSSDDNEEEDEEFIFELPFGGPFGRPDFGGCGGRGGFGGRGGHFGRHGFGGPGFGGPGFGKHRFGRHGFGGPGFGGPGFEESDSEEPAFGPGFHGRSGFGGRGGFGGRCRGRGPHGRGGHFGGPGRFEKESAGPDFDFLKSFGHEEPHHMPPREHKHFYFA